jgi:hypothetical protein
MAFTHQAPCTHPHLLPHLVIEPLPCLRVLALRWHPQAWETVYHGGGSCGRALQAMLPRST